MERARKCRRHRGATKTILDTQAVYLSSPVTRATEMTERWFRPFDFGERPQIPLTSKNDLVADLVQAFNAVKIEAEAVAYRRLLVFLEVDLVARFADPKTGKMLCRCAKLGAAAIRETARREGVPA